MFEMLLLARGSTSEFFSIRDLTYFPGGITWMTSHRTT
jgi:hypothetical protein